MRCATFLEYSWVSKSTKCINFWFHRCSFNVFWEKWNFYTVPEQNKCIGGFSLFEEILLFKNFVRWLILSFLLNKKNKNTDVAGFCCKRQILLSILSNLAKALVKYVLFNIFQRQNNRNNTTTAQRLFSTQYAQQILHEIFLNTSQTVSKNRVTNIWNVPVFNTWIVKSFSQEIRID